MRRRPTPRIAVSWSSPSHKVLRLVVFAHVGDNFLGRRELPIQCLMPWRAEGTRIVECHADVEMPEIGPPNPLGDVQHPGMRNDANPTLLVVTDGVDDERVAIPLAD